MSSAKEIPTRRAEPGASLPFDYGTTPGGTIYSTTPGGNNNYDLWIINYYSCLFCLFVLFVCLFVLFCLVLFCFVLFFCFFFFLFCFANQKNIKNKNKNKGTRVIYGKQHLLSLKNSPTPSKGFAFIPGISHGTSEPEEEISKQPKDDHEDNKKDKESNKDDGAMFDME